MNNSPRGRGTDKARTSPDLEHLNLVALRVYRKELAQEEERISYWRRLVQARLDVLRAASKSLDALSIEDLVKALGETGTGVRRQVLLTINGNHPLPDLPGIGKVWHQAVDPRNDASSAAAEAALMEAEEALTSYRKALHVRLSEATGELISRYIEEPGLSLDLLPPGTVKPS